MVCIAAPGVKEGEVTPRHPVSTHAARVNPRGRSGWPAHCNTRLVSARFFLGGFGGPCRGPPFPKPGGVSRSATASPGCSERWGVWGAMSGPPMFLVGELADLDVDPTVELLALVARVVAQGTVLPDGNDLDRGLRRAEIDQELLDGLCAPLRQNLVVFRRALAIGVALDEHHPGARPVDDRGRVLKNPDGIGPEADAL